MKKRPKIVEIDLLAALEHLNLILKERKIKIDSETQSFIDKVIKKARGEL